MRNEPIEIKELVEIFEHMPFPTDQDFVHWFGPEDVEGKVRITIFADQSEKTRVNLRYKKFGNWTQEQLTNLDTIIRMYEVGILTAWERKGIYQVSTLDEDYSEHGLH
jgi:hypothetical protein